IHYATTDGQNATGDYFLVQVKGTESTFADEVKMSNFPTKTVEYSKLFHVPFFVFHTSIESNETRFVWLQKYADHKLERTTPNWKAQDSVTIYFPSGNDLTSNRDKIVDILEKDKSKKIGVGFLSLFESLKFHGDNVLSGQYAVGEYCHSVCLSLVKIKTFIDRYSVNILNHGNEIKLFDLGDTFRDIAKNLSISNSDRELIKEQLSYLEDVKHSFLIADDIDDLAVEMKAYEPY
ncbi:DUF4365 domain-containing protein, partial [Vibrio anguillarum]|uniref:DUF4365 domain-containing protein n=1 Tax=Vibrio anguillarum TaxID=55601 RepID=UPI00188D6CF2